MASSPILSICSLSILKIDAWEPEWTSENLRPVLSLLHSKSFCGFHITRDEQKSPCDEFQSPMWSDLELLTSSSSFFPSHTVWFSSYFSNSPSLFLSQDLGTFHLFYLKCSSLEYVHGSLSCFPEVFIQIFPIPFDLPWPQEMWKMTTPCLTLKHFLLPWTGC